MTLENIQKLTCLPRWFYLGLTGLQELMILGCQELTTLNVASLQHSLHALQSLWIRNCPRLISLFEEEQEEEGGQQQDEGVTCKTSLKFLGIHYCEKLEKLPRQLQTLVLAIGYCPSLVSFPETGLLPSMLRTLYIEHCKGLRSLPEWMVYNNLEHLTVRRCQSLTSLSSRGGLPPILQKLEIYDCEKLESLLPEKGMYINCPHLQSISISCCKNLKSLPDVMSNNDLLSNLCRLEIYECDNLECLPEGWLTLTTNLSHLIIDSKKLEALPNLKFNNFASLQELKLYDCPAGGGILSDFLKEGSFFTNLTSLTIGNIEIGMNPSEWGLHRLFSLRQLHLQDYCWVSFPEEEGRMLLPTSLIELSIINFPNLEKLYSNGFQNLTSLEELRIRDCPKLASFPKEGLPPSLSRLWIKDCRNLASFPDQGLPPSLLKLEIEGCPILKRQCEKEKGQYWPFISHIPFVCIDYRAANGQAFL